MLGTLLDLGLSFAGMRSSKSAQRREHAMYREQLQQAQGQFDQQMDHSVRRRVEDAKRAGIHPLFAMGASVGASPTLHGGQPPTGSATGDILANLAGRLGQIDLNKASAERDRASAKRDEAEAAYLNSRRAMLTNEAGSRGRDGAAITYPMGAKPGPEVVYGPAEYVNPLVPTSKAVGIESGTRPGTIDVKLPDGRTVNLLSPNIGMDEISQGDYLIQRARHYTTDAMWALRKWAQKNFAPGEARKLLQAVGSSQRRNQWSRN